MTAGRTVIAFASAAATHPAKPADGRAHALAATDEAEWRYPNAEDAEWRYPKAAAKSATRTFSIASLRSVPDPPPDSFYASLRPEQRVKVYLRLGWWKGEFLEKPTAADLSNLSVPPRHECWLVVVTASSESKDVADYLQVYVRECVQRGEGVCAEASSALRVACHHREGAPACRGAALGPSTSPVETTGAAGAPSRLMDALNPP